MAVAFAGAGKEELFEVVSDAARSSAAFVSVEDFVVDGVLPVTAADEAFAESSRVTGFGVIAAEGCTETEFDEATPDGTGVDGIAVDGAVVDAATLAEFFGASPGFAAAAR